MSGFPAFGACFTLLFLIWHKHYVYFRRYGLQDTWTVTLTGASCSGCSSTPIR